ncbi:MAG TPA: GNAT family N-acetyltransferase [Caulobacteraceae bacterium]|nr:GNAT family N-acetyltransferase [Caulobacteraceae bacterium]
MAEIRYRPMVAQDIGRIPMDCHGGPEALAARIADLGAAAILAFDGDRHVGQLQFRRHDPKLRSPSGIWSPDYWGDFGADQPALPPASLGVFCHHVGQLEDGPERDPRYQGRGIGLALLDELIAWAPAHRFEAIAAKFTPADRAVMKFMGGQSASAYEGRGFEVVSSWVDPQLQAALRERGVVAGDADPALVAGVGMCVKRLG